MSSADRDCLHALAVIFGSGEGRRTDAITTDTGSYRDPVFGLAHLLDEEYRPALMFGPTLLRRTSSGSPAGDEHLPEP
ncbi:Tn3 family transposase [Nonomuraea candida]|uniref:Tn3 family transposase n=1 Tax=Nonomuraea candida TaxID=359159 RepID=UPI0014707788|nr:Tn3 family transposase [Nonomuraea candida]